MWEQDVCSSDKHYMDMDLHHCLHFLRVHHLPLGAVVVAALRNLLKTSQNFTETPSVKISMLPFSTLEKLIVSAFVQMHH